METQESRELAQYALHDGATYPQRLMVARSKYSPVIGWAAYTSKMAKRYTREFGGPDDDVFSTVDILLAAAELAAYYEDHVKELDA